MAAFSPCGSADRQSCREEAAWRPSDHVALERRIDARSGLRIGSALEARTKPKPSKCLHSLVSGMLISPIWGCNRVTV
jgi:hypothetical protein